MSETRSKRWTQESYSEYQRGEVCADELFDPIWEEVATFKPSVKTEWDDAYQKQIEAANYRGRPTFEEQKALATRIQDGKQAAIDLKRAGEDSETGLLQDTIQNGIKARDELVTRFLPLATWFARESMDLNNTQRLEGKKSRVQGKIVQTINVFSGVNIEYADRVQIASMALVEATNTYTGSARFSTWAFWTLESRFLRADDPRAIMSGVPHLAVEDYRKISKIEDTLTQELGRRPSLEEVSIALQFSPEKVVDRMKARAVVQDISYEAICEYFREKKYDEGHEYSPDDEEDNVSSLAEILVDSGVAMTALDEVIDFELGFLLDRLVSILDPREQQIIEMHLGLGMWEGSPHVLEEIGAKFGLSKERIRQIEAKALANLRKSELIHGLIGWHEDIVDQPQYGLRAQIPSTVGDDEASGLSRALPYNLKNRSAAGLEVRRMGRLSSHYSIRD